MTRPRGAQDIVIGAVILAAGRSGRMGRPKLLLPWGGTSVLGHLVAQWQTFAAEQVAVVCAGDDRTLTAELDRLGFPAIDRIFNPAPEQGMFSSILGAARWPGWKPTLTHWAIVLGDQPHLRPQTLRQVLDLSAAQPERVCQPSFGGRPRHPVLLPRPAFVALADSTAASLKTFLASQKVAACEVNDPGLDLDIDRAEDYQRALLMAGLRTPKR